MVKAAAEADHERVAKKTVVRLRFGIEPIDAAHFELRTMSAAASASADMQAV
jgi:hypothetical protein